VIFTGKSDSIFSKILYDLLSEDRNIHSSVALTKDVQIGVPEKVGKLWQAIPFGEESIEVF
jgi:hypothetical protein